MAEPLNVLIAVLDGARADHLSCYGYGRETTPFLDQVAREGVRFTNMITTEPCTLAAHAALFTGLQSVTHGATEEHPFLAARHPCLPEYFKSAGYRTAAFCVSRLVSPETGFGRGLDAFFTQRHHNQLAARALVYGRKASDKLLRRDDAGARRTMHALRRWVTASERPFFAFVHFNETRLRFRPPRPYDRIFLPPGVDAIRARAVNQDSDAYVARRTDMDREQLRILTALYDGELRYADRRLRETAEFLRARGVWDRTLFMVTAAHGEYLGDHGLLGHRLGLHDSVVRVPLILRCPAILPQGFVVEDLAQTTDVLPTILPLVGIPAAGARVQGRALLNGKGATPGPAYVIAERFRPNLTTLQQRFPEFDRRPFDVRQKAIRSRRDKFIWRSDESNELYDLVTDPGETTNLIDRRPARADALRRALFDWLASVDKFEPDKPAPLLEESGGGGE